ncbi:MAG: hypothetical protein HY725_07030 [Candidatus Rokubacteria bacterium]|nr:hypothetical protein [Candidatus Rokubacteria bacterium]
MDFDVFVIDWLVRERLREARRGAEWQWAEPASVPRGSLREALGLAMIRAGCWMLGEASPCAGGTLALRR